MGKEISTGTSRVSEAWQILDLQYLCFQSQAATYGDRCMPPLTQTLDELIQEYDRKKILVARLDDEVIGSVRARMDGKACRIDRLMVHPGQQNAGLGEELMREIEADFPEADSFELFTGHRSESNIRLYRRLGYETCREEVESDRVTLLHMRKPGPRRGRSTTE